MLHLYTITMDFLSTQGQQKIVEKMGRKVCNQVWNGLRNVLVCCVIEKSATMKRSYTRQDMRQS